MDSQSLPARETTPLPLLTKRLMSAMREAAATHREGIIPRDIEPDNTWAAREGEDAPVVQRERHLRPECFP